MSKILVEGLAHLDMEHQIYPVLEIDRYDSEVGDNDDMVTMTFTVKQQSVAEDLVDWLERGYDWVIDAETSPGEVNPGKYLVFVELNRRSSVPRRVVEILDDLQTLTGLSAEDWKLKIKDELYPATEDSVKNNITLSPKEYRDNEESALNEWREIAGINTVATRDTQDPLLQQIQRQAGIL